MSTVRSFDCLAGPSPGCSSRGARNQKEGPRTRRGGHIFKVLCYMYATVRGPNVKWGHRFQIGALLVPPLATALLVGLQYI